MPAPKQSTPNPKQSVYKAPTNQAEGEIKNFQQKQVYKKYLLPILIPVAFALVITATVLVARSLQSSPTSAPSDTTTTTGTKSKTPEVPKIKAPSSWQAQEKTGTCGTAGSIPFKFEVPPGYTEQTRDMGTYTSYTYTGAQGEITILCGTGFDKGTCERYADLSMGGRTMNGCAFKEEETNDLILRLSLVENDKTFAFNSRFDFSKENEDLLKSIMSTFEFIEEL